MIARAAMTALAGAVVIALPARAQEAHAGHGNAQQGMMCMAGMEGMHGPGMQHGQPQGGMHGQAQAGMQHGMMGYIANPAMLLHHQSDLNLTAAQVTRIEALQKQAQDDCAQHMKLAHDEHQAAAAALQAQTPDLNTFEAKLRAAAQHMVQAHVAVARRGVEALNVLTAEQRTKLQTQKHEAHGSGHKGH